jgi:D-glycero-D-manno-heptose 1,7-bisphosphate phosphatase
MKNQKSITIGLGRDGVINQPLDRPISHPKYFIPIANSIEAISLIRNKGYNVVILSNQPGISQHLISTEQVDAVHQYMLELLGKAGCRSIDGIYYSTTNLKQDIYAKPNNGMFKRAEKELRLKFKSGAYVGDKISDLKVADKIGAIPVLVKTGDGNETIKKLNTFANRELKKKTQIFENLWEFANSLPWIE